MEKKLKLTVMALFIIVFIISFTAITFAGKILATLSIDGYYVGTETGDYVHTTIKTIHGEEKSFWGNNSLTPFLEKNKGKLMRFTYKIVDEYFPEGKQVMRIEVLEKANIVK